MDKDFAQLVWRNTWGNTILSSGKECVFCKIVRKELDANIVFEDNMSLGFLDAKPLFLGHCLIVPKQHCETLLDLPGDLIPSYFRNVQLLTKAVQLGMESDGTFVAINNKISQSVPHLHVHVVPRRKGDQLHGFFWPRQKYDSTETLLNVQKRIVEAVTELSSNQS